MMDSVKVTGHHVKYPRHRVASGTSTSSTSRATSSTWT